MMHYRSQHNHFAGSLSFVISHETCRPDQGKVLRLLRHDRYLLPLHRRSAHPLLRIRRAGGGDDEGGLWYSRHSAGYYADRGTSTTSKTVATLLSDLEVTCVAFQTPGEQRQSVQRGVVQDPQVRPRVSRTVRPCRGGAGVHGHVCRRLQPHPPAHRHRTETPADIHYGLAAGKAIERSATLAAARTRNPERSATSTDPKILTLPSTAWINKPTEETDTKLAA